MLRCAQHHFTQSKFETDVNVTRFEVFGNMKGNMTNFTAIHPITVIIFHALKKKKINLMMVLLWYKAVSWYLHYYFY